MARGTVEEPARANQFSSAAGILRESVAEMARGPRRSARRGTGSVGLAACDGRCRDSRTRVENSRPLPPLVLGLSYRCRRKIRWLPIPLNRGFAGEPGPGWCHGRESLPQQPSLCFPHVKFCTTPHVLGSEVYTSISPECRKSAQPWTASNKFSSGSRAIRECRPIFPIGFGGVSVQAGGKIEFCVIFWVMLLLTLLLPVCWMSERSSVLWLYTQWGSGAKLRP